MRKKLAALVAAALLATSAGCGKAAREPVNTTAPLAAVTALPDGITYVTAADGTCFPVSWVREGEQVLSGDLGPLSLLGDVLTSAPAGEDLPEIPAPGGSGLGPIASDGDWNFFPEAAEYRTYTLADQPRQPEWTAYFEGRLEELGCDSPVVLTQAAVFQWDGREAAVVTACNASAAGVWDVPDGADLTAERPASSGVYCLTAVFRQGEEPAEVYAQWADVYADMGADYAPWEGESAYLQVLTAIQYDRTGALREFPVYANMTGELALRDISQPVSCLVADVDGDGLSECVAARTPPSSVTRWCTVYGLEQGAVTERMRLGLG